MIGIYRITSPSNKVYIGQSSNIETRFKTYKYNACKGQPRLFNSFKKYGFETHKLEVIERCAIDKLNIRERYWQDFHDSTNKGLNCMSVKTELINGSHCNTTKLKISQTKMGVPSKLKGRKMLKKAYNPRINGRLVLNTENGIYYSSVVQAAHAFCLNRTTLDAMLRGRRRNKTQMKLA